MLFQCYWCDNRCSSGIDRNRQDWYKKDCEKLKLNPDDICASEIPTLSPNNVDISSTETLVKSESRNLFLLYFHIKSTEITYSMSLFVFNFFRYQFLFV